jgi:cytochrome c556
MKKSLFVSLAFAVCSPLVMTGANAQAFPKSEDAIKYRQGAFQIIKAHFSALQPVVKGQVPYNKEAVIADVAVLDVVAKLPWSAFGAGTEGGDANDDIWLDEEGFKKAQQNFLATLAPLTAAADSGDLNKLKAAFAKTGASCKSCHDAFRK